MRFMFACGGTAGHINPALAVAGRLRELMPDSEFLFVGAVGQMEIDLVPRAGYRIETVRVRNISRSRSISGLAHNISAMWHLVKATRRARKLIRDFKPDVVIGTGGYVCYPVLKAASQLGIPTAVHESNAVPGLTTKMLSRFADLIMLGFEESRAYYAKKANTVVTGTPVRGEFGRYTQRAAKAELGVDVKKPLVVSVWGSLGAEHMNEIMCDFIKLSGEKPGFTLIHSAGTEGYEAMLKRLEQTAPEYERAGADVREYIYDMPRVMAAADLVLCRAGASTVSELAYMHKPTVFVPSPYVTNNHQYKNAMVVVHAGGAEIFEEGKFTAQELHDKVIGILNAPETLEKMSAAMQTLARPDATDDICARILDLTK